MPLVRLRGLNFRDVHLERAGRGAGPSLFLRKPPFPPGFRRTAAPGKGRWLGAGMASGLPLASRQKVPFPDSISMAEASGNGGITALLIFNHCIYCSYIVAAIYKLKIVFCLFLTKILLHFLTANPITVIFIFYKS